MITKGQIAWINENINLLEQLENYGIRVPRNKVFFCPFHENTNTPAAKYYENSNKIWCFSENKLYGCYDFLKLHLAEDEILKFLPAGATSSTENFYKVPVLTDEVKKNQNNIFAYLKALNSLWLQRDGVECIRIKEK